MITALSYAVQTAKTPLAPFSFSRREPGPKDVSIDIVYCGVCHSDVHQARGEWQGTKYPCVPGHEIVGRVTQVGSEVSRFKVGDTVGVGCMVDSCQSCASCDEGLEQYCQKGFTGTYNGKTAAEQLAAVAPLLCAGITTWSPLRHWKVGPGQKVGIVGIGGLGHMGIKLAHALGAHVVAFTTSEGKRQDALDLGADEVVVSKNKDEMKAHAGSFHFILNTVAASHNLDAFSMLLRRDGTMCLCGVPEHPHPSPNVGALIFQRRSIGGSLIGGIAETQEMLDFCAEHGIVSEIEMIPIAQINAAYDRMVKSDVKYRFVIDIASLKAA